MLIGNLKKQLQYKLSDEDNITSKCYGIFSSRDYLLPSYLEDTWELRYSSLFEGVQVEEFETVAPYLVELPPVHKDLDDILRLYGDYHSIFLCTPLDFDEILYRMRALFNIEDDEGNAGWFLFFNPVVLRNITQEADPEIMQALFEGVTQYYCEAKDDPTTLYRYRYEGSEITMKTFSLEEGLDNV